MKTMKTMTKSSVIVCSFPNISPINTAEAGITQGHYDDHYSFITNETVPLQPVQGAKDLHLVCFDWTIGETGYVELLRADGKQPCRNSPQYLLGLMAQVPEERMPEELRNKDLVAAEPDNEASAFTDERGYRCFLCVGDRRGGYRLLNLVSVDRGWLDYWAFLAEDSPVQAGLAH